VIYEYADVVLVVGTQDEDAAQAPDTSSRWVVEFDTLLKSERKKTTATTKAEVEYTLIVMSYLNLELYLLFLMNSWDVKPDVLFTKLFTIE
jgi:hypothetical protein